MSKQEFAISFLSLFRFSTTKEKILVLIGVLCGFLSGFAFAAFPVIWGKMTDLFVYNLPSITLIKQKFQETLTYIAVLGVYAFLINCILFTIWKVISVRVADGWRQRYLASFITQNTLWIEQQNLFELSNSFQQNHLSIQKAVGDKIALYCNLLGTIGSSIATAFFIRWNFALVLLSILPFSGMIVRGFIDLIIKRR